MYPWRGFKQKIWFVSRCGCSARSLEIDYVNEVLASFLKQIKRQQTSETP